jgi:peptidyl-prolyl cis-trans isomerase D
MLNAFRTRRSSVLVWLLMALLIIGLAGFGIGAGSGLTSQDVARVGEERIPAEAYARALDQDLRNLSDQAGRQLSLEEARDFGLDRMTLLRLVNNAALDNEAVRLGLSAGDEAVREQLRQIDAFQTADGFDREAYLNALNRIGINTTDFEAEMRDDIARSVYLASVTSAARVPDAAADALVAYVGERRAFDWLLLGEASLPEPVPAPGGTELADYHEAHQDRYMRPEIRRVTYAIASPEALAEAIEIPEAELRAAYEAERGRFETPERRLLERIGFGTEQEAEAAMARIEAGAASFDDIAAERGLAPEDMDLGMVEATRLAPEARDVVFGLAEPGVAGPVPSRLGPSLYRVNAIFDAEVTPFEDARDEIARERATEAARQRILDDLTHIEDLIAGGARLEEIAEETVLDLGTIDYGSEPADPLAQAPAFREALLSAREGEETDLVELADGSYVTLRLEGVEPPAPIPLEEIRAEVAADWRADRLSEALGEHAETLAGEIRSGASLEEIAQRLGATVTSTGPILRNEPVEGAPAGLLDAVFEAEEGSVVTATGEAQVALARVTDIVAHDPESGALAEFRDAATAEFDTAVREDLRAALVTALRDEAGVRINQDALDGALERFQ